MGKQSSCIGNKTNVHNSFRERETLMRYQQLMIGQTLLIVVFVIKTSSHTSNKSSSGRSSKRARKIEWRHSLQATNFPASFCQTLPDCLSSTKIQRVWRDNELKVSNFPMEEMRWGEHLTASCQSELNDIMRMLTRQLMNEDLAGVYNFSICTFVYTLH